MQKISPAQRTEKRLELLRTTAPYNDLRALGVDADDKYVGKKEWFKRAEASRQKTTLCRAVAGGTALGFTGAGVLLALGAAPALVAPLVLHGASVGISTGNLFNVARRVPGAEGPQPARRRTG